VLRDLGVVKGDRVIVYMPMVPEAAIAMLACARIGAIHSVVFGGFSARELATRIDDAKPKVMVAGSCGIEPNRIVPTSRCWTPPSRGRHKPEHCVILQREQVRRADPKAAIWTGPRHRRRRARRLRAGRGHRPAVHPLHLRHHRQPKGVVRDNGGHAVAMA
jgi:propionyl-CoA synthetase